MRNVNKLFNNATTNETIFKNKINKDLSEHSRYIDDLYKDKEIDDVIKYLYLYSYPVNDPIYNSILIEKNKTQNDVGTNPKLSQDTKSDTPKTLKDIRQSLEKKSDSSITLTETTNAPEFTSPAIIFGENKNMDLSKAKNSSGVMGY